MMQHKVKIWIVAAIIPAIVFIACSKYKDPPAAQPDPRLADSFYCNDSRAVNYNWGFPGVPDNSICIYPVDSFLGNWVFTDTLYLPNGDTAGTIIKNLTFTSTEDTTLTRLAVTGWCSNAGTPFYITANKYRLAEVDTMLGTYPGQYLCNNTDTLNGTFNKNTGVVNTMKIELTITNAAGTVYHKGTATRQ